MISLQNNIFENSTKAINLEAKNSIELKEKLNLNRLNNIKYAIYKNDILQNDDFDIEVGDNILVVFYPSGNSSLNNILGGIGLIAVSAASFGLGSLLAGSFFGGSTIASSLITTSLSIAGGMAINAILPKPKKTNLNSGNTYGFGGAQNGYTQGMAVPITYGTHQITPPLIVSFLRAIDNQMWYFGVYALNDGFINNLLQIKLNDEDYKNSKDIIYEERAYQGHMNNHFQNEELECLHQGIFNISKNKDISDDTKEWLTSNTKSARCIGFELILDFPNGLYRQDNNPKAKEKIQNLSVAFSVEISKDGTNWYKKQDYFFKAKSTKRYFKMLLFKDLEPSRYYFRIKRARKIKTGGTKIEISKVVLHSINEFVAGDFLYPNTALLGIKILATGQFNSSVPKLSCLINANSSNPALIVKDMLKRNNIISIDEESFKKWEDFCNEKNLQCNIVFDTEGSLLDYINQVSSVGRAKIIQLGRTFKAIIDKKGEVAKIGFSVGAGNILKDNINVSYLPFNDRSKKKYCYYYDKDKNYEKTPLALSENDFDKLEISNSNTYDFIGITSREQALRELRFRLNMNKLSKTIEFSAFPEAAVVEVGDIISVSRSLVSFDNNGVSGRIVNFSENLVVIDTKFLMKENERYAIFIRNELNELIQFELKNKLEPSNVFEFRDSINVKLLQINNNYFIDTINNITELYRVLKTTKNSDNTIKISAIEYNECVYDDEVTFIDDGSFRAILKDLEASFFYDIDNKLKCRCSWIGNSRNYRFFLMGYNFEPTEYDTPIVDEITNNTFITFDVPFANSDYYANVLDNFGNRLTKKINSSNLDKNIFKSVNLQELSDEFMCIVDFSKDDDFLSLELFNNSTKVATSNTNVIYAPIYKLNDTFIIKYVTKDKKVKSAFGFNTKVSNLKDINNVILSDVDGSSGTIKWDKINTFGREASYNIYLSQTDDKLLLKSTKENKTEIFKRGIYEIEPFYITKYGCKITSSNNFIYNFIGGELDVKLIDFNWHSAFSGAALPFYVEEDKLKLKQSGTYEALSDNIIDLGTKKDVNIVIETDFNFNNPNNNFDLIPNVDDVANIDGVEISNENKAMPIVLISDDGIDYSPAFTPISNYSFRYLKFGQRVTLMQKDVVFECNKFNITIGYNKLSEEMMISTIPYDWTHIVFDNEYDDIPNISIEVLDEGDFDVYKKDVTKNGFFVKVIDDLGKIAQVNLLIIIKEK